MSASLPVSWSETLIGKVARIVGGGTPPSKDAANFAPPGRGTPWVTPADLSGYRAQSISRGARDLSPQGLAACSATLMPAGTVLFSSRAPVGYVAIAANEISTNQGFKSFVFPQGFDPRFAYYQLKHLKPEAEAIATGTTFKELSGTAAATLPIKVAPSREQERIADELDTLLARVNACNDRFDAIPALLKRFRQAVLNDATSGALTDEWRESSTDKVTPEIVLHARLEAASGEGRKKALEAFCANHPPRAADSLIPPTWVATHVGMVGMVSNGSTPSRMQPSYWNGSIPWVSSGEVNNNPITTTREAITELGLANSSVRLLPQGTVLIAMIGEGKTRGQSALLELPACINQNVAGVVPVDELLDSKYLWYWFQAQYETTRTKGNGSGPKALNCERVRELEVHLPPKSEQTEIVRRVEALFALADRIEARCNAARTHAQRLAPQLLAKAFRGELVPQDPNDEPASALLARIAAERSTVTTPLKTRTSRMPRAERAPKETAAMTKSRQDADVSGQPYLAAHLRRLGGQATAELLFKQAELPVADFYKQLAWEVAHGHVLDGDTRLAARDAA
jgi:type I restriction enzyme, S subunit